MNKKELKFTFRGVISVYAKSVDEAFEKIGKHYLALSRQEDNEDPLIPPTNVKMGVIDREELKKDLRDIINEL